MKKNFLNSKYFNKKRGVVSLISTITLGGLVFLVSLSLVITSYWQLVKTKNNFYTLNAYYSSYSGIQDALLRLERDINFNGSYNLSILEDNDVSISVLNNNISATITSVSSYLNNFKKIEAIVSIDQETGQVTIETLEEKIY